MARKDSPTLLNSLNSELAAGADPTTPFANSATSDAPWSNPDREKLGRMVRDIGTIREGIMPGSTRQPTPNTEAFNKGKTTAYPVPATMAMPATSRTANTGTNAAANSNSSQWNVSNPFENRTRAASTRNADRAAQRGNQAQSPVSMRNQNPRQRGGEGGSLIHSTIRAMELLGEHEGNNKKIIESMVNK